MGETPNDPQDSTENDPLFQEKHRVISKPLPEVKDVIDQLDLVLTVLDDDNWKPHSFHDVKYYVLNKKIRIPDKDLEIAIEKLCDDKYVSVIEEFDGRSPVQKYQNTLLPRKHYRISYAGRFFRSNVSKKYKDRPYRNQQVNEALNSFYTSAKTVASVTSTVLLIAIGAWGVYVADKSNKMESTIDGLNVQIKKRDHEIDSIINVRADTLGAKAK